MDYQVLNLRGLNTYVNPFLQLGGEFTYLVNVDSEPFGGKTKRAGFQKILNNPDSQPVTNLFSWTRNDGTTTTVYRTSGSVLYYSNVGIGTVGTASSWNICGNGTIKDTATVSDPYVSYAVLEDTLFITDGVGSIRYTTNGTSFTDTTLAPFAYSIEEYQNRIYAAGTASTLFYSTAGDGTNWSTAGTSDSSSFNIPGAGKLGRIFKQNDRLVIPKNSGNIFKWDGYDLIDMATKMGPTASRSIAAEEDYRIWLNRKGLNGYGGTKPTVISNKIQNQFYNRVGNATNNYGINPTKFENAFAAMYRYKYLLYAGSFTDNFTDNQISNGAIVYNYQTDEYSNYAYSKELTALGTVTDFATPTNPRELLLLGDTDGWVYVCDGTHTSDDGDPISAQMEFFVHAGVPQDEKDWKKLTFFFNPGCQAQVMVSASNSFEKSTKKWIPIGDVSEGVKEWKPPSGLRGNFLWVRVKEMSKNKPFTFYGMDVGFDLVRRT